MRANGGASTHVLSNPYNVKPGWHDTKVTCPYVPGCPGGGHRACGNFGRGGRGRGRVVERCMLVWRGRWHERVATHVRSAYLSQAIKMSLFIHKYNMFANAEAHCECMHSILHCALSDYLHY